MVNISNADTNDLLQFALENDTIDLSYVQEQIEMKKREEILQKHQYKIWHGNDGLWYTYIPNSDGGRKLRKRRTRKGIEDLVVAFLREQDENPTVRDVFDAWLSSKVSREDISKSTKDRYQRQFSQCFRKFGDFRIKQLTEYDVEEFILDCIHDERLTPKGYSNFRTIVYGIFKYAKRKGFIGFNITETVENMEISKKAFRREMKPDDGQVFMLEEVPMVERILMEKLDITNLGLLLLFKTGLRVGELSALKKEDIGKCVIHVNRTEISYHDSSGKTVYEVRNFPKTEAGIRDVVLPESATWIMDEIISLNPSGDYVFMKDGKRMHTNAFRDKLYRACEKAGIKRKSPHKIRKTYGSTLIDGGCEESMVISQMGHTNIGTTKKYYYKNRRNLSEIREKIDGIMEA